MRQALGDSEAIFRLFSMLTIPLRCLGGTETSTSHSRLEFLRVLEQHVPMNLSSSTCQTLPKLRLLRLFSALPADLAAAIASQDNDQGNSPTAVIKEPRAIGCFQSCCMGTQNLPLHHMRMRKRRTSEGQQDVSGGCDLEGSEQSERWKEPGKSQSREQSLTGQAQPPAVGYVC